MTEPEAVKKPKFFSDMMTGRRNNFDFLRFFFATLVIYHHSFDLLLAPKTGWGQPLPKYPDLIYFLTNGLFESGYGSVNAFFAISGFLITSSWIYSATWLDFIKKRVLRIYPGWIAAIAFCVFIIGPLSGVSIPEYFKNHDTYLMFRTLSIRGYHDALPGVFGTNPFPNAVNGSLWTLPFELKCYAVVALFGLLRILKFRYVALVIFVAVQAMYFIALTKHLNIAHFGDADKLPRLLSYFLSGMVFFLFKEKIPYSKYVAIASVAIVVATSFAHMSELFMPICGSYLVFYLAYHPGLRLDHFSKYGDFSYGLYIYAFPVQQLLIHVFDDGRRLNPYSLTVLSFVATLFLSVLSWYLIEKPFLSLKPKTKIVTE